MDNENGTLCPDTQMASVLEQLRGDSDGGLSAIAAAQQSWPLDPRLHFLKGSMLAGMQRYDEGRQAMARSIEIAPDFALARFQLGFLDLTSGRAIDALGVWQKLEELPDDAPLRLFAEGLANLAADNFIEASRLLKKGMALNQENPLINTDMQLILDEIEPLAAKQGEAPANEASPENYSTNVAAPPSAVDMLLRQQELRDSPSKLNH